MENPMGKWKQIHYRAPKSQKDIYLNQKIETDADLSYCSYGDACSLIPGTERVDTIYVSTRDMVMAGRLAEKYNLRVIVIPILPHDGWAISSEYRMVYSPGP